MNYEEIKDLKFNKSKHTIGSLLNAIINNKLVDTYDDDLIRHSKGEYYIYRSDEVIDKLMEIIKAYHMDNKYCVAFLAAWIFYKDPCKSIKIYCKAIELGNENAIKYFKQSFIDFLNLDVTCESDTGIITKATAIKNFLSSYDDKTFGELLIIFILLKKDELGQISIEKLLDKYTKFTEDEQKFIYDRVDRTIKGMIALHSKYQKSLQKIDELETQLKYTPGNSGYKEAKKSFEKMIL